jgi:hypothetical protein
MGTLGLQARPLPWLAFGLAFDGRYDRHVVPGQAADSGLVGDPRAFVRFDRGLGEAVRVGARLGLWLPGGDAPSLSLAAATPELLAALTYQVAGVPLWLTANAGYRLDRSAHSVEDAARLSPSDRLALGVSAFDQALLGVSATYGRETWQGFLEASGDFLVGARHPPLADSPLRLGLGARMAQSERLRFEAMFELLASARPDPGPTAPLVPIPPRAAIWLGLVYRASAPPVPPVRTPTAEPEPAPTTAPPSVPSPPSPPSSPATVTLAGVVRSETGEALDELRVTTDDGPVDVDAKGRFTISGAAGDTISVRAEAMGHEPATGTFTLAAEPTEPATLTLRKRLPSGSLRGLVRSLDGHPLDAQIRIEPTGRELRAAQGRFDVSVAPGWYEVTISAPGRKTQRRRVQVEDNGVTLLNVDLRGER